MVIHGVNYALMVVALAAALALVVIIPIGLSLISHGRGNIGKDKENIGKRILIGLFTLAVMFLASWNTWPSVSSMKNINGLNNHYGIIIDSDIMRVLPGASSYRVLFTDGEGELMDGTLVIRGNKAKLYIGTGLAMHEYRPDSVHDGR